MKKWNYVLTSAVLWITVATMFTSCLEGGKNSWSEYTIGIVRLDTKTFRNVLDVPGAITLYSPAFDNMKEGACCYVLYEIDMNAPENDPAVLQANGYYTVVISFKEEVDRYMMSGALTDTATVLTDEIPLVEPLYGTLGYLNGILFIAHQLKTPEDQKNSWQLSYDSQNMMQDENGRHIYNVYLRATVKVSSSKSPIDVSELCAYDMKYFMESAAQKENSAGSSTFYVRFNYASEIKGDALTWKQSDMTVNVNEVLPAN